MTTNPKFTVVLSFPKSLKPKTLAECLSEASCFPFTVKAIADTPNRDDIDFFFPINTIIKFNKIIVTDFGLRLFSNDHPKYKFVLDTARWQLLDHSKE